MQDLVREKTRRFLARHFNTAAFADDTDIFAAGLVNSLFALQLVLFVESEFGFAVRNEDLEMSNFRSVDALVAFVTRSAAAAA